MSKSNLKFLTTLALICLTAISPLAAFAEVTSTTQTQFPCDISCQAKEAAKLIGIEHQLDRFIELRNSGKLETFDQEATRLQLTIVRKVMTDLSIILCQRFVHEGNRPSNSIAKRLKTAPQSLKG